MIKEALEYLAAIGSGERVLIKDREYSTNQLYPIKTPTITPLYVHTLTGLVDYITSKKDLINPEGVSFIHIVNHNKVDLYGLLIKPWELRNHYISVDKINESPFNFNSWYELETFVIELQSKFEQDANTAAIMAMVGNISDSAVKTLEDDGVTQRANVMSGIRRAERTVPNPVNLSPFRTFSEVIQPCSQYILRLKSGAKDGELPGVALFEADGGKWKLDAIQNIKVWLQEKLPEMTIIA